MRVLIACEESQMICKAFRAKGHEAYSCDIQRCSGGVPEWHIIRDCLEVINGDVMFMTEGGETHYVDKWDLVIAHPPCTYISTVANRSLSLRCTPADRVVDRMWKLAEAAVFFMRVALSENEHLCIENPQGYMGRLWRKPDQTIHPYYFANGIDDAENYHLKRTCLWLKGLPPLERTNDLPQPKPIKIYSSGKKGYWEDTRTGDRSKVRSKTFPGIAKAMADQWG